MPGSINNEDYTLIDITKGIYATNPFQIPDGFSAGMKNFVIRDGIVEQRMAFKLDSVSLAGGGWASAAPQLLTNITNLNVPCNAAFKKLGAAFFDPIGAGNRLVGFPTGPFGIRRSPVLVNGYIGGLVAYNGVVYASSGAGIVKLDVSNWPTAVGETLVPGGSGVNSVLCQKIIVHKSRLFGFTGNRLKFTDAPAVGGLPETWNPTVNFIDFNGQGVTTIFDIVSLNNYIYVFTNAGLFSLYTTGAPANWVVRNINPDVSVRNYWQVVIRNNLIYYITDQGIFVTDGFDFKKISQSLSEYFNGIIQPDTTLSFLQPFDNGILLVINKKNAIAFGFEEVERTFLYTKLDSIAWTEWNIPTPDLANPNTPEYIWSTEIYDEDTKNYETRAVIKFKNPGSAGKTLCMFGYRYRTNVWDSLNFDELPLTNAAAEITGETLSHLVLELTTKPLIGSNFMRIKFFRDCMIILGSRLPCLMVVEGFTNGKWIQDQVLVQETPYADPNVLNTEVAQFIKVGLSSQQLLSLQIRFTFLLLWGNVGAGMVNQDGRYAFSIPALGYTATLERTAAEGKS